MYKCLICSTRLTRVEYRRPYLFIPYKLFHPIYVVLGPTFYKDGLLNKLMNNL